MGRGFEEFGGGCGRSSEGRVGVEVVDEGFEEGDDWVEDAAARAARFDTMASGYVG